MRKSKQLLLTLIAAASLGIGTQVFAEERQTLELDTADVAELHLTTVKDEADANANEIHQESTVGRAGLQGSCVGPFDDE